jgi:hypothetical protein
VLTALIRAFSLIYNRACAELFEPLVCAVLEVLLIVGEAPVVNFLTAIAVNSSESLQANSAFLALWVIVPVITKDTLDQLSELHFGGPLSSFTDESGEKREQELANEFATDHFFTLEQATKFLTILAGQKIAGVYRFLSLLYDRVEREWFLGAFSDVIWCAIEQQEFEFLSRINIMSRSALKPPQKPNKEKFEVAKIFRKRRIISAGNVDLDSTDAILPLEPEALKDIVPQPFVDQEALFRRFADVKDLPLKSQLTEQTHELFIKHAKATQALAGGAGHKPLEKIPVEFFIPKSDDFEAFCRRIQE